MHAAHRRAKPLLTIATVLGLCTGCASAPIPDGGTLLDRMRVDGGGLMLDSEFGATALSVPPRHHLRLGVIREPDTRNRFAVPDNGNGLATRRPPMRKTPIKVEIEPPE